MALKFKCQNCGKDIIVKFLKVGETTKCKHCGDKNVVPETAIESGEKMTWNPAEDISQNDTEEQATLAKRPMFIWIIGIVLMVCAAGAFLSSLISGRQLGSVNLEIMIIMICLLVGFLGVGVFMGNRVVLIVLKVFWVLWCIMVVLSFLAGSCMDGPNWGHGVGLLLIILTAPMWSGSVKAFCQKKGFHI